MVSVSASLPVAMEEHLQKTLEQAKRKLAEQEEAVAATKKFINQLCQFGGAPAMFADVAQSNSALGLGGIRSDSFYGKGVSTAVREYLEMRFASNLGAASHAEIISALEQGGFDFTTIAEDEVAAKRGVAITLGKNTTQFHKLPNGNIGLLIWYPEAAKEKKPKKSEVPKSDQPPAASSETKEGEPSPATPPSA